MGEVSRSLCSSSSAPALYSARSSPSSLASSLPAVLCAVRCFFGSRGSGGSCSTSIVSMTTTTITNYR